MDNINFFHKPVLLNESIDALRIKPDGIYVDATAGGGGHSAQIAKKLKGGRLILIDQDPDAIKALSERMKDFECVTIVQDNFCNIKSILNELEISGVDGILADLGVSSRQLDTAQRGFSFHNDAPLDMRMSQSGTTAADLVNTLEERELSRIITKYGEEKFARSIARNIVKARQQKRIETTLELSEIIKVSMPAAARREGHPARRTFQALRIEVNGEIEKLDSSITDMFKSLNVGGVLAVITFHSLEDRTVKHNFVKWCKGCTCPSDFPICICGKTPQGKVCFKAKPASDEEIKENPRSRSAKLRALEKLY